MRLLIKLIITITLSMVVLASCGGKDDRKMKYLEKGKAYLEENNLQKAKIEFKNVVQIDPKFSDAYFYMGLVEEKSKEPQKAYGYYQKAVDLNPDYIEPKLKLAEIYTVIGGSEYFDKAKVILQDILDKDSGRLKARLIQQQISYKEGNEEAAIKEIEKLVEMDPSLDNGINLLASAYAAKGEIDKALNILDKGIKADNKNINLRSKKISILMADKRFDDVEKELIEILNLDKSIYASHLALSSFYSKINKLEKAENILRDGINEDPDDLNRSLVLVQFLANRQGSAKAIGELNSMIAAKPDAYELKILLGRIYRDTKENEKAKKLFSMVAKESNSDVDRAHANNLLAEMLISEADVNGSKLILDELLKEHPNNFDALHLRGKVALIEKDFKSAINYFRSVNKLQPDRADISKMLAQAYFHSNEYELAENVLMNAIKADPKSADARISYVEFLVTQKRDKDAKKALQDARNANKSDYSLQLLAFKFSVSEKDNRAQEIVLDEMKETSPDKRDVYINRGNYYLTHKKYDKALDEFKLAFDKSSSPPEAIESLEMIARIYAAQNKVADAIKYMKQRIASNPKDILSRFVLANIYSSNKDMENAKKYYRSVMDVNKVWPKPYQLLAAVYKIEGNIDQAINVLKEGLDAANNDILLEITLAGYLEIQKKYDEAMLIYKRILNSNSNNMVALNNLATLLLDHSKEANSVDDALSYASKLDIEQNIAFKDTMAWAYAKSGDYQKSIDLVKPIADESPKIHVFQYHAGYALYHNGQKDEARKYLEKAVTSPVDFSGKDEAKRLIESY